MSEDWEFEETLRRLVGPVDRNGVWASIETRAGVEPWAIGDRRETAAEDRASTRARKLNLRVIAYASLAVVIVAAITVGSLEAAKHLGNGQPILVIGDDTTGVSPGSTGETTQTPATSTPSTGAGEPLPVDAGTVNALVMDPSNAAVLYAGTENGLFRSTDGAASWTRLSIDGRVTRRVTIISVDPNSPSVWYINAGGWSYRSVDSGATWTPMTSNPPYGIAQLWIDSSTSPSTLYTQGGYGSGPYKSNDEGSTWEEVSTPDSFVDLAIDPYDGTLYAVLRHKLWRSSDAGATWEDLGAGIPTPLICLDLKVVLDPRDPSRLYLYDVAEDSAMLASAFVSLDGGETWSELTGPELDWAKTVLHAAPGTPASAIEAAAAFLGDFTGTIIDTSSGAQVEAFSWAPAFSGKVIIDPDDPSILYLPTERGVYKSTDQGENWNQPSYGTTDSATAAPQTPASEGLSGMFRGNLQRTGVYPSGGPSEAPEVLWKFKVVGADNSSPVISDGVVYFGSKDGYLYALDAKSGQEKWKFDAYGTVYGSPAVSDGVVYFAGDNEHNYESLYAVDTQTGQEKWSWMYVGWSSPAIFDGMIYMGSSAKDLETGLKGWSVGTGGVDGSCPSLWDGAVYFGVTGYFNGLYAVDIGGEPLADTYHETSLIKPLFATEDPLTGITGAVAISDGVAYFGNHFDSSYVAVDLQTAQEKWRFKASEFRYPEYIGQFAIVSPAVSDGLLYGGSEEDGDLYAVDIETGQEVWKVALDITELSSPSLSGTTLYVGSKDGYLYALDARTGQERWKFQTGGAISSSPAIWDGVVYFASKDGYLYALQ